MTNHGGDAVCAIFIRNVTIKDVGPISISRLWYHLPFCCRHENLECAMVPGGGLVSRCQKHTLTILFPSSKSQRNFIWNKILFLHEYWCGKPSGRLSLNGGRRTDLYTSIREPLTFWWKIVKQPAKRRKASHLPHTGANTKHSMPKAQPVLIVNL